MPKQTVAETIYRKAITKPKRKPFYGKKGRPKSKIQKYSERAKHREQILRQELRRMFYKIMDSWKPKKKET